MEKILETFRDIRSNPYRKIAQWKDETGGKVLGCLCTYSPYEIIHAAGIQSVRLYNTNSDRNVTLADSHMPNFSCSFARSCLDSALKGEFDFFDGIIFPHTCDTLQCLNDILKNNMPDLYCPNVVFPTLHNTTAQEYLVQVLKKFKLSLEEFVRHEISNDSILESIKVYNQNRALLKELYDIRSKYSHVISYEDFDAIVESSMLIPKEEHNSMLSELLSNIKNVKEHSNGKPRVFILGNSCGTSGIVQLIEEAGGLVVGDDLCTGSRYYSEEIEVLEEPLQAIASYCCKRIHCPSKYNPDVDRTEYVIDQIKSNKASGIIYLIVKFCDPHGFEFPLLKEQLREEGIPLLDIDIEYNISEPGQLYTRLEAFLEMIN